VFKPLKTLSSRHDRMNATTSSRLDVLKKEGWTRQFVASEPRLSEAVAVYKELGFEVHLEPLPSGGEAEILPLIDSRDGCAKCFEGSPEQYKIIFTRPTAKGDALPPS
jgi:hypothetical protein